MPLKKCGGRLISKLILGAIEMYRVSGCSSVCPFIRAGESQFRSTASFVHSMAIKACEEPAAALLGARGFSRTLNLGLGPNPLIVVY